MYYVYVIESQSTGNYYIGQTLRLFDRITEHNRGKTTSTRSRVPWNLVGYLTTKSRSEAVRLERKLKGFKRRDRVYNYLINNGQLI